MSGLTERERLSLVAIGLVALAGLSVVMWRSLDLARDAVLSGVEGRRRPRSLVGRVTAVDPSTRTMASGRGLARDSAPRAERKVPRALPVGLHTAQWDHALASARQIDINTASAAELERLPGVGPTLARRIVESRDRDGPFNEPEELSRVKGIGPSTSRALHDYVTTTER